MKIWRNDGNRCEICRKSKLSARQKQELYEMIVEGPEKNATHLKYFKTFDDLPPVLAAF